MVKIFLVEDDPLMVRMYEKAFRLHGYEVELAFNGEEAIAKLEVVQSKPTLILLDIMMPKLSGFDVLRHMKADAKLKGIPVVVLTNLAGREDAEKALALGAVLYLVKSQYDPKDVVAKVEEVLAGYNRTESIPDVKVKVKDIPVEKGKKGGER